MHNFDLVSIHRDYPTAERAPFNPALLGTPDDLWAELLQGKPELVLPKGPLLIVGPHPDDEVLGAGGVLRRARQAGRAATLLSVTDGEAAHRDWQGLGAVRRAEVQSALGVLQGQATTCCLAIPDGQVSQHRSQLAEAIDRLLSPDMLVVAPYEQDGHPDHDATGEVCCEIARAHHAAVWRYPIWLWHHGVPESCSHLNWGLFPLDRAAQRAKAHAMTCFASQLHPPGREPIVPAHVMPYFSRTYEAFVT